MGALRLTLAIIVATGHALALFGGSSAYAFYAVDLFFIISGFYMALILNEKYIGSSDNITFYLNRAIRIYPVYFLGIIFVLFSNSIRYGQATNGVFEHLTWGGQAYYIFMNIFALGYDLNYFLCFRGPNGACAVTLLALNPPAWSIAVELMFYLVAPFILRSTTKTIIFMMAGVVYFIAIRFLAFPLQTDDWPYINPGINYFLMQYHGFPGSFMFFGLGALSYRLSRLPIRSLLSTRLFYPAALSTLALMVFTDSYLPWYTAVGFAIAVPYLFRLTMHSRLDRQIGELSYPTYILHWPILYTLYHWGMAGSALVAATVLASVAFGALALVTIDRPLEAFRHSLLRRTHTVGASISAARSAP